MSIYDRLAVAALLHDIGKWMQRAELPLDEQSERMKGVICPRTADGRYSHLHVLWTNRFFEKYFPGNLDLSGQDSIANLASYHHYPQSPLQELLTTADRLSSGERDSLLQEDTRPFYKAVRLKPVLAAVTLEHPAPAGKSGYPLRPLATDKGVAFPTLEDENMVHEYRLLFEGNETNPGFMDLHRKLPAENLSQYLRCLYYLLERYTWCIPSSTVDYPDISLFDHAKTTAAIASCLYGAKDPPFLLLGGDLSGIQQFLNKIARPGETDLAKGVAKRLRGRSLYLQLLPEMAAYYIIDLLQLNLTHVLYCSGGNFQLLLPNNQQVKTAINDLKTKLDDYFWSSFGTDLGLVLGSVTLTKEDLGDYGAVLARLQEKISEQKERKFLSAIKTNPQFFFPPEPKTDKPLRACRSCQQKLIQKARDLCNDCNAQETAGAILPRTRYILYSKPHSSLENLPHLSFGFLGDVHLLTAETFDQISIAKQPCYDLVSINTPGAAFAGIKFLGSYAATAAEEIPSGTDDPENFYHHNEILGFEMLAEMSTGDKKLAFVKVDVDHLGRIFSQGLEKRSISRLATMSRQLELFFSGYTVCSLESAGKDVSPAHANGCFYLAYAGGDDLLFVGPWDAAQEWLITFVNDFSLYCGHNPNITVSAGVSIHKPHFPLNRAVDFASEALTQAKNAGRNRVTLFGQTQTWQKQNGPGFYELLNTGNKLARAVKNPEYPLPRRMLHKLFQCHKMYISNEQLDPRYIGSLLYILSRNVNAQSRIDGESLFQYLFNLLVGGLEAPRNFESIRFPLIYALMKTRKGGN